MKRPVRSRRPRALAGTDDVTGNVLPRRIPVREGLLGVGLGRRHVRVVVPPPARPLGRPPVPTRHERPRSVGVVDEGDPAVSGGPRGRSDTPVKRAVAGVPELGGRLSTPASPLVPRGPGTPPVGRRRW